MDIASLLSGSVPSYFVIGPLGVVLVLLVVLLAKKSSSTSAANAPTGVPASTPVNQQTPLSSIPVAPKPASNLEQFTAAPMVQSPLMQAAEQVISVEQVKKVETQAPQGTIPPVSAWKPLEPKVDALASDTQTEAQLQAKAVAAQNTAAMEPSFKPIDQPEVVTAQAAPEVSSQVTQDVVANQTPVAEETKTV